MGWPKGQGHTRAGAHEPPVCTEFAKDPEPPIDAGTLATPPTNSAWSRPRLGATVRSLLLPPLWFDGACMCVLILECAAAECALVLVLPSRSAISVPFVLAKLTFTPGKSSRKLCALSTVEERSGSG